MLGGDGMIFSDRTSFPYIVDGILCIVVGDVNAPFSYDHITDSVWSLF